MKLNCSFSLTLATLFFSSVSPVRGQQPDSSFTTASVHNAIGVYHQKLQRSAGLYNGAEYADYDFNFQDGSPYFGSRDSVAGSVTYDGVLYEKVLMKYNELKDVVIIWYNNDAVQLLNEKISDFRLGSHSFTRIIKDNQSKGLAGTGFYEQLYPGKSAVLKKTVKTMQQKTDISEGVNRFIDQKTYFYLKTPGGYIQVNNKADLTGALKDHKNEITDFIKSNNLNFKQDPDGFLTRVAAYYDTL